MYPRFVTRKIKAALEDTRVVLLAGPRQAGKTTLARSLVTDGRPYFTLDDATTLAAALADPTGFIRGLQRATIDEIQRAPDLLLAIKESVDREIGPGRFLLTGSANLMALPRVADSLAGRMETIRLLPLAQAEILDGEMADFLLRAFDNQPPGLGDIVLGEDLVHRVLSGGYPESLARKTWARKEDWALNYIDAIVQRDVRDVAAIGQLDRMPRLLKALAVHSGQLVNHNGVGAAIGLNHVTTRTYTCILEQLFLIRTLDPWHNNALKRLTKTPKLHFIDSGLLAALRGVTPTTVRRDRGPFGAILESFVFSELLKGSDWSDQRWSFSHYRDKDGAEVDIVIEDRDARIVGIEVKASASVDGSAFAGLKKLAAATGDRFVQGLVLHDHGQATPFGERFWAAPISSLWA